MDPMAHIIREWTVVGGAVVALMACGNNTPDKAGSGPTPPPKQTTQTTSPTKAPELIKPPRLTRAEPLPKLARNLLHKRMHRHAGQMQKLFWAATLVDRHQVKVIANAMADESRIAKPDPADVNSLNHVFPKQFFALQEELRVRAVELAAAANKGDDTALATAYGQLSQVCVRCHSLYLTLKLPKTPAK